MQNWVLVLVKANPMVALSLKRGQIIAVSNIVD